jgi:hypothetical protein
MKSIKQHLLLGYSLLWVKVVEAQNVTSSTPAASPSTVIGVAVAFGFILVVGIVILVGAIKSSKVKPAERFNQERSGERKWKTFIDGFAANPSRGLTMVALGIDCRLTDFDITAKLLAKEEVDRSYVHQEWSDTLSQILAMLRPECRESSSLFLQEKLKREEIETESTKAFVEMLQSERHCWSVAVVNHLAQPSSRSLHREVQQ